MSAKRIPRGAGASMAVERTSFRCDLAFLCGKYWAIGLTWTEIAEVLAAQAGVAVAEIHGDDREAGRDEMDYLHNQMGLFFRLSLETPLDDDPLKPT